jgi:threonine/homoserine/homoserine lactone efflux protein
LLALIAEFGVRDYQAFVIAVIVFLLVPGPGNLALITSTSLAGLSGGLAATLGVIVGDQCLIALAMAGMAAVLLAYPAAFHAMQWLGATYLIWLGASMLFAGSAAKPIIAIRPGAYFRQAWLITVFNPKAIVFYMAFFPIFIQSDRSQAWIGLGILAFTVACLTLMYGLCLSLIVVRLAQTFRQQVKWIWILEKSAGLIMIAFAIRLAFSKST